MQHLFDQFAGGLQAWLAEHDLPAYRAEQIERWLFDKRADSLDAMSDLPKSLRSSLAEHFTIWTSRVARHTQAADGTEKLLLEWPDRQRIECVLIRERHRRTVCISTQVGCGMGCVFCASGLDGVARNLSTGEIIEQLARLAQLLPADERLSHIVVMGMGEPLANVNNLLPALEQAGRPSGLGIGARRITISTVGLPAAIERLAERGLQYHLAVSLHAPNDALRNQLVPVNDKIGIAAVLAAADRYFESSGRRLTFEYVLLGGINDRPQHARQLAGLLRGGTALLNVIPYNPVAGLPYQTPAADDQERFLNILRTGQINVQVRRAKGTRLTPPVGS